MSVITVNNENFEKEILHGKISSCEGTNRPTEAGG